MNKAKRILAVLIAFWMMIQSVYAQIYYEDTKTREITRGVTHTYMERLADEGWQKINVLTADLTDENVDVAVLYDKRGISYKSTLSKMTKDEGAVAAINADFFDTTTDAGRTTPLGLVVKDEEIISSASHDSGLASLIESDGNYEIGYFQTKIYLCADNGNKAQILHINKYHSTQSMVLFTKDFGEKTPENKDGSIEMIVEGDIVKEIVSREEGSAIPKEGYVIRVNPAVNNFFNENFKAGDKAEIEFSILPEIDNVENAVGGGTKLVEDGKVSEFTHNIQGANPRSAAGISKNGKTLYLVTVEGREKSTPGMTQKELANFMISLGAYNAINFDGGGSTEMTGRGEISGEIEVINTPSGGSERAISTGIGIKSVGEKPKFDSMKLFTSKENVCIGDNVEIWVTTLDNYKNPIDVGEKFEFSADDGGKFAGNKYFPVKSGERTITAEYGGVKGTIKINVLKEIASISFYPPYLPEGGGYLSVVAADSEGFKSQISPEQIGWRIEKGKGSVSNGNVKGEKGTIVSATYSDKIIELTIGKTEKYNMLDKLNTRIDNADFIILPSLLEEDTLLNRVINEKILNAAKNGKNVFSFGNVKGAENLDQTKQIKLENSVICSVRNDLPVTDAISGWQNFLKLEEAKEKNICIYLAGGYEFSEESSKAMFDKTVKKLYNLNKNVLVVCPGEVNDVYIDSGVRYITLKKSPEISLENFEETFSEAVYLEFKITDNKLFYDRERLFA